MPTICQAPGLRAYESGTDSIAIIITMFSPDFLRHENKDRETEKEELSKSLEARMYSQVISHLSARYEKVLI